MRSHLHLFMLQPTSVPGREGSAAPAPAPAQPGPAGEGQPPKAPGQEAPPGPFGGGMFTLVLFALPLLLIFMMTRNQSKKQKQLESALKAGDRVVTQSGLLGKIIDISPNSNRVRMEIAPGVNVQILKSAIQGVDGGDAPADAKAGDKDKAAKDKPQEKKA